MNQELPEIWEKRAKDLSPDQLARQIKHVQMEVERKHPAYYDFAVARLPILLAEQAAREETA